MTTYRHPETGEEICYSGDVPTLEKAGWERIDDKPAWRPSPPPSDDADEDDEE